MTRLYIVRHGQSEWNLHNKVQGTKNTNLSELGIKQAHLLADRLSNFDIDYIYTSDLNRAYETAKIIAEHNNKEVKKLTELREMSFGIWEGLTSNAINKLYKDLYELWKTSPEKVKIEKAETLEVVQKRIINSVKKIIRENPNKNILIVSHGTSIKALILGLLGIELHFYTKIRLDNTSLSIIDIKDDGKAVLTLLNDTCHLRSDKN